MKIECTVEEFKKIINISLSHVTKIGNDAIEIKFCEENEMDD